jgi:hypothetical protein
VIAAALFAGFVLGASLMILIGLYLVARKPKPEEVKPATCHAVGLGDDSMEQANEYFVKAAVKQASDGRSYEIEFPQTRH